MDTEGRALVGDEVTSVGSDAGLAEPMREQVQQRGGRAVGEQLLDGGYVKLDDLDRAAAADPPVRLTMPVPRQRTEGADPHQPKRKDSAAVATWRVRMGTAEAKQGDKDRAAPIETVPAELKAERGLGPFRVRGLSQETCAALWSAPACNVMHLG